MGAALKSYPSVQQPVDLCIREVKWYEKSKTAEGRTLLPFASEPTKAAFARKPKDARKMLTLIFLTTK